METTTTREKFLLNHYSQKEYDTLQESFTRMVFDKNFRGLQKFVHTVAERTFHHEYGTFVDCLYTFISDIGPGMDFQYALKLATGDYLSYILNQILIDFDSRFEDNFEFGKESELGSIYHLNDGLLCCSYWQWFCGDEKTPEILEQEKALKLFINTVVKKHFSTIMLLLLKRKPIPSGKTIIDCLIEAIESILFE